MQEHDTETAETVSTLRLSAPLTIRRADEIAEALLGAIEANEALALDLPEDGPFDLSFVQIVEAARVHARAQGKTITLASPAAGPLLQILDDAGFLSASTTSTFWLESGASQ
jgi:MFS superfamily sulfate permease-like transporter